MAESDISGIADDLVPDSETTGKQTGIESSLSSYAGPYVTDMLGTGAALADMPYEPYEGPLTADESQLQKDAFSGISALTLPTDAEMGAYAPKSITDEGFNLSGYMNPYLTNVVDDQVADLQLAADKRRLENAARMTAAGSYGGSRQAIQEGLIESKLLDDISQAINTGNVQAYERAIQQFNLEQDKKIAEQDKRTQYGFDVIDKKADLGGIRRGIEQEGIDADIEQFEEEMNFPYKQVQFMQSLLQNLPLETQQYTYAEPSQLANVLQSSGGLMELYNYIFGGSGDAAKEEESGGIPQEVKDYIDSILNPEDTSETTVAT